MNDTLYKQISEMERWFNTFYRPQLEQAQRAQRTSVEWHASDGVKTFNTLAELDSEANNKQNQIRALKTQIQG